jgi:hypothetical protein
MPFPCYEEFCDDLWTYARERIGSTDLAMRETEFCYADTLDEVRDGACTMQQARDAFCDAVVAQQYR